MSSTDVLLVEDEPKIADLLEEYLHQAGFSVSVLHEGTDAVTVVRESSPGFLILDLMLPGKDGLTICKEVRQFSSVPIMMLTARVDEIDRLLGLELGADDYVCKPFSPREVVARVRTIQRRLQQPVVEVQNELRYRDIALFLDKHECQVKGHRIELTPVEFNMLRQFMSRAGRVFSRQQLMDVSYTDARVVSDRTIDTHVKNLRKKLAAYLGEEDLIHAIYGIGYKFE